MRPPEAIFRPSAHGGTTELLIALHERCVVMSLEENTVRYRAPIVSIAALRWRASSKDGGGHPGTKGCVAYRNPRRDTRKSGDRSYTADFAQQSCWARIRLDYGPADRPEGVRSCPR
jgi:hypothetical protein